MPERTLKKHLVDVKYVVDKEWRAETNRGRERKASQELLYRSIKKPTNTLRSSVKR